MTRLHGLFASAVVTAATLLVTGSGVQAQPAPVAGEPEMQVARLGLGSLNGVVTDQYGDPIEGATVSAIGATMVFAVSDRRGRFVLTDLVPGQYLVRAHRTGFLLTDRDYVTVQDGVRAVKWVELQRAAVGTAGSELPRVLTAGFNATAESDAQGAIDSDDPDVDAAADHPHTDAAWRLRHARRSVLKDAGDRAGLLEEDTPSNGAALARTSASLSAGLPFSGEINLLTTGSIDSSGHLFVDGWPRGVTYVSFGSLTEGTAGWEVQAAVSSGDVSSWIVAGSYVAQGPRTHAFDLGGTFGAQQYAGGNPAVLAVRSDGTRQAGTIYAFDNWAVSPGVHLSYGARMSRYDYVSRDELWSPRVGLSVDLARGTRLRASVGQQMRAPGAEEFLPPAAGGPWLPPERTFSPLSGDDFRVEQIRRVEVSLEREVEDAYVIAIRRFFEAVDDQLVTIFGARTVSESRSDVGHYLVGNAGAFDANGWGVRLSTPSAKRLRGAVDYQLTRATWNAVPDPALNAAAASAVRSAREDVHDVATSLEADINETATRVFFYYRLSSAYSRDVATAVQPALGARFDLQVKQALPFMPFRGSQWEVLVGIRDLFRDPLDGGSVYDELLVIRPPKRVIGGVQVKF